MRLPSALQSILALSALCFEFFSTAWLRQLYLQTQQAADLSHEAVRTRCIRYPVDKRPTGKIRNWLAKVVERRAGEEPFGGDPEWSEERIPGFRSSGHRKLNF